MTPATMEYTLVWYADAFEMYSPNPPLTMPRVTPTRPIVRCRYDHSCRFCAFLYALWWINPITGWMTSSASRTRPMMG